MEGRKTATIVGEAVRHTSARVKATCEISAVGHSREDIDVNVLSPSKTPVSYGLSEENGVFFVEFVPQDVGTYIMDVFAAGQKLSDSPVFYKVYDATLIRITEAGSGVVGQPCQFKVDASQAGEGQLEISINDGEVPNHVQVLGGGRCLVHFTPELAKPHTIDIKFNGEPIQGCPFVCKIADTSKVSVALHHLELFPVNEKATFQIHVDTTDNAELAVSVTGPRSDLPVEVTGNVKNGFLAEFVPDEVGPYIIGVDYNNIPVGGTPFTGKAYDSSKVMVSAIPWGTIGKPVEFTVDASKSGEGNLEITISARGRNIPTQVHPLGSARFAVSFVPMEGVDHTINITFNKDLVPGAPFTAKIHTDPNHIIVSGQSLAATAVGKMSYFTLSNVIGSVEDIEIAIDSPSGESVPAQVQEISSGTFKAEFCPKVAGEHQIFVSFGNDPVPGSPFPCKVYNVEAIQVRECKKGIVGKPVTFLVETSQAGPGNLEVTVNNGQVPTSAQAQGNHTYAISFVPKEAKPHIVELKFNGENVPGSPFKCTVVDAARVTLTGEGLEKVPVDKQATFFIEGQTEMGDPEVKVVSPQRKIVPSSIRFVGEGHYGVDYHPTEVGDHQVEVKISDLHVHGSPFVVKAYDATKVAVSNFTAGVVNKPVYFSIDASHSGAGNLEIIVSVNNKNVPNYVQSEGNAKFRVNFKPTEAQTHLISVKFNNEPVPNSPFECSVRATSTTSGSGIMVTGPGVKMTAVNKITSLVINAPPDIAKLYDVTVTSPTNEKVEILKVERGPELCVVEYEPGEVGPHLVKVTGEDGEQINGSPFTCNVYDSKKVTVAGLEPVQPVGKPLTFTVDASQAGEGTLELVVTTAKTSVRAEVQARSRGLYDVTFVPQEISPHFVNITFNDQEIKNSPFQCKIVDEREKDSGHHNEKFSDLVLRGDGLRKASVGRDAVFTINFKQLLQEKISIRIVDPRGSIVPHRENEIQTGISRISYCPKSVGKYAIHVLDSEQNTAGKPIKVDVFDPNMIKLSKIGDAVLGQDNRIRVDTAHAGEGALSVTIRAAGQEVKHSIQDLANGQFDILFYPTMAIPHKFDVKYNGLPITSSPVEAKVRNPLFGKEVTASGKGLYHTRVGRPASFILHTLGRNSKEFDVIVSGPADVIPPNEAIPVRCYQQKDGNLLAEFITRTSGNFKIEVLDNGRPIVGSPFQCLSFDPGRVRLLGVARDVVHMVDEVISFRVERTDAGFAELDVTVTSPLGGELPLEIKRVAKERGEVDLVEFMPEAAGNYKFMILYGDEQVPGSPLTFTVEDKRANELRVHGDGLSNGQVNEEIIFFVEATYSEPNIKIRGPNTSPRAVIHREKNGTTFVASFIPNEIGPHDIIVSAKGSEGVLEKAFQAKICNAKAIVPVNSGGWTSILDEKGYGRFSVGEPTILELDTSKAGPGYLQSEVVTQYGEVRCHVDQSTDNRAILKFTPEDPVQHNLVLRWNGKPLSRNPVRLLPKLDNQSHHNNNIQQQQQLTTTTSPSSNNNNQAQSHQSEGKVRLTGQGLVSASCGEENHFTIDGSAAPEGGKPEVQISNQKTVLNVKLKNVGYNLYQAFYSPRMPGTYLLNVLWSGRQVKGCPLKVTAEDSRGTNRAVICSGDGLRMGTLGKDIKSFIDTRKAGPGELNLHCVGPHGKTAYCELNDHQDGTFTLHLKPQEPGRHQLSIQYGGAHVQGSPFTVRVSGAPDPTRVKVYGPGVEHGVLAMYQSRFICDTRGAGAGQLTVRIRGPKGAFRVEMQRESQKDRTILCKYEPTEPGDYRIEVKWSGENVPGSPFMVMIFDTQEELSRFLQGGYSPTGNMSEMYGSIGNYSTNYGQMNYSTGTVPWRENHGQLT